MREKRMQGSITVEAVFVIPFLMILFLTLLWLSFYLHDKCVIEGTLCRTMEEGGDYILYGEMFGNGVITGERGSMGGLGYALCGASDEEEAVWEESFRKKISGKLFLYRLLEMECQKNVYGTKIFAKFGSASFFPVMQWGLAGLLEMEFTVDRCCPVREEVTRAGSVLLEIR